MQESYKARISKESLDESERAKRIGTVIGFASSKFGDIALCSGVIMIKVDSESFWVSFGPLMLERFAAFRIFILIWL
jgi:hypothetical protein